MLAVIGITAGKGTAPSCDPYGTFLRTEGCNDIYADGDCGEYSEDNGSCDPCYGCPAEGTYLRTEGCNDIFADGSGGEYSQDNGSCNPCDGCNPAGTFESTGTGTAWANTVDAEGTDWSINYYDYQYSDGCCGTYSERHWFSDVSPPFELSSPDGGVSPNPPAGYVLTASAINGGVDANTYASYADDEEWTTMTWLSPTGYNGNYPWYSYKIVADGSGGSTNEQTVQDAGTIMSDAFPSLVSSYARFYATGTTFEDGTNGTHPSFDIISCPLYGTYIQTLESGVDWNIDITLESLGTPYSLRVGSNDVIRVTDGQCSTTAVSDNFTPEPVNTLLYDETISSYYYYSDGAGGYYSSFYG